MGMEYILEAMQHHGLGHLPQPDNFTTCGRLGIEINQYNNPVECYHDDTIEEMRDEKIILDHPELADKIKGNTQVWLSGNRNNNRNYSRCYFQKHKEQINPMAAQKLKANNYDPRRSAVLMAINAQ